MGTLDVIKTVPGRRYGINNDYYFYCHPTTIRDKL